MKLENYLTPIGFFGLLLFFSSCTPIRPIPDLTALRYFNGGRFQQAAQFVEQKSQEASPSPYEDRVLKLANEGMILHTAGHYRESNKVLLEAAALSDYQPPVSLVEQAGQWVTNEKAAYYRMEDFERTLVHLYLALNYALLNQMEDSLVECRRAVEVQDELAAFRNHPSPPFPLAHYLAAILFESQKRYNDAYIEYVKTYKALPSFSLVQSDLLRLSQFLEFHEDHQQWKRKFATRPSSVFPQNWSSLGQLVVLIQVGLAPKKVPDPRFPFLPAWVDQPTDPSKTLIRLKRVEGESPSPGAPKRSTGTLPGSETIPSFEITAIGRLLKKDLQERLAPMTTRLMARLATKGVGTAVVAKKYGRLAGTGAGLLLFSQEEPDLRSWSTLPDHLSIVRCFLPPGSYTITLVTVDRTGHEAPYKKWTVVLEPGHIQLLTDRVF